MHKRTIGRFALATALFMVLLTSAVPTRAAGIATGVLAAAATVNLACLVSNSKNVSFGRIQTPIGSKIGSDPPSTGNVSVTCNGGPYSIGLSVGNGAGASFATRKMTSGSNTLNYSLYSTADHSSVWGDGTPGSVTVSSPVDAAGTHDFPVYGLIFAPQSPEAGAYTDTITVTVTFTP